MTRLSEKLTEDLLQLRDMKGFAELFKKYRLRAEFETFASFGDALAEKGFYYEDSIFSHWQKGTRIPTNRLLVLKILEIFVEKGAIKTLREANEFFDVAGKGYLTKNEIKELALNDFTSVPFQVPSDIFHFVGREEIINEVSREIVLGKVILLHGPAGVGKTALATKLGHLLRDQYPDGVLWYKVDSSNIMDILLSIAYVFGENISTIKSPEVRASVVRTLLLKRKVLLIFDNVTAQDTISLLLPNTSNCGVIITSQENFHNSTSHYHSIKINTFTDTETLALFATIFDPSLVQKYKKSILSIGEKLGHLPLATHISAHIIATYGEKFHISMDKSLEKFDLESIDLQNYSYEDKNLFKATTLAFNTLDHQAKTVFISLGVFEGQDFSINAAAFLNNISVQETFSVFEQLRRLSFIQTAGNDRYRIHPLLKVFARKMMTGPSDYLRAAEYYEKLLAHYEKEGNDFFSEIRQEIDNIIFIFKKCYEFQYWDPITNLWNLLEHQLQYTKEIEKLRSLAKNVQEAKKINVLQKILIVYVVFHLAFWFGLHISLLEDNFWTGNLFNFSLAFIPLFGGIAGLYIASTWGLFKNFLGKALICIGGGLLFWSIGDFVVSGYGIFLHNNHPYPSWGDLFFLICFYGWAIGIFLLSQAAGTKYSVFKKQGKRFVIVAPLAIGLLSLFILAFFVKDYGLLSPSITSPRVLLNLAYAFVIIVIMTLALVIFRLSFGFFGGRYKIPMYSLLIGFTFIYLAIAFYYPLIATNTYVDGNWGDFFYSLAQAFISFGALGFYKPNTMLNISLSKLDKKSFETQIIPLGGTK